MSGVGLNLHAWQSLQKRIYWLAAAAAVATYFV